MNSDSYFSPFIKISPKWIIDLIVKPKTIKLVSEIIKDNLQLSRLSKVCLFFNGTHTHTKENIDKLDFVKI